MQFGWGKSYLSVVLLGGGGGTESEGLSCRSVCLDADMGIVDSLSPESVQALEGGLFLVAGPSEEDEGGRSVNSALSSLMNLPISCLPPSQHTEFSDFLCVHMPGRMVFPLDSLVLDMDKIPYDVRSIILCASKYAQTPLPPSLPPSLSLCLW